MRNWLIGLSLLAAASTGCGPTGIPDLGSLFESFGDSFNDSGDDSGENDGGDDDDADGSDDADEDGDTDDDGDEPVSSGRSISGLISSPASKLLAGAMEVNQGYQIVAQSADTMEVYTGDSQPDGSFSIEIPEEETGDLFLTMVLGPDGRALGPVMFNSFAGFGSTGIELDGNVSLGTIDVPGTPGDAPIFAGDDANLDEGAVADDVLVRLDDSGVPVGAANVGKGDGAVVDLPTDNPRQQCDVDMDGMLDDFDADDNGNGTIDDLDAEARPEPQRGGIQFQAFMNLKIGGPNAQFYFTGDEANIEQSLENDTVITFEVNFDGRNGRTLTGVTVLETPGPAYLPLATVQGGGLWSDTGYALNEVEPNHFNAFVTPHAFIDAGDAFTIVCTFDDGSTRRATRMLNYVFRSIPKLELFGAEGDLQPASVENLFDGTQDLVLEWHPPVDERGRLLVGFDYRFEVFFHDGTAQQINDIDGAATWPTPPTGWRTDVRSFDVAGSELSTLSADDTLSVTLPAGIFVDTVETGGGPVAVGHYVIDIAAQRNGNNSALKVEFEKE